MAGLEVEFSKPPTTGMQNHRGENQSGIVSDDENHKMQGGYTDRTFTSSEGNETAGFDARTGHFGSGGSSSHMLHKTKIVRGKKRRKTSKRKKNIRLSLEMYERSLMPHHRGNK